MTTISVVRSAVVAVLVSGCGAPSADPWLLVVPAAQATGTPMRITGTVEHSELEGGFYLIRAANGTAYDPSNLPDEFRKAGLKVEADIIPEPDIMSIRQAGPIVRVIRIRRQAN